MKTTWIALAWTWFALPSVAQVEVAWLAGAAAGDHFGVALSGAGDVDGDGTDDLAVGAPGSDLAATDAGEVRIYSGRNLQLLRVWTGPSGHAYFGRAIAAAGDLDGDGVGDVVVGAPQFDPLTYFDSGPGFVEARSGATGAVLWTFSSPLGERLGWAVAGGGEIDGDGVPDVLVGDPDENVGAGRVRALSGATGLEIYSVFGSLTTFGFALDFLGDLDGDGRDEFVVGEPNLYAGTLFDGLATAIDGASGTVLWTRGGAPGSCGDEYGWTVVRSDDLSGDGRPDVLIGGRDANCLAGSSSGFADARDGASGALLFRVKPTVASFTGYGIGLAAMSDLDGDGLGEVAVGGPGAEPLAYGDPNQPVLVASGNAGATLASLPPSGLHDAWGYALLAFDANDDGLRDLIVGSPLADAAGANSGLIRAYTIVRGVVAYCESQPNSLGCVPFVTGVGTPSASLLQPFRIKAFDVLNNRPGLLFYGYKPRQSPFQGGQLCVVAPTRRTPVQDSGGQPPPDDCSGSFSFDFNQHIRSGVDPLLVAGAEIFAQYWSRDPASASTTNLTDALAFYVHP